MPPASALVVSFRDAIRVGLKSPCQKRTIAGMIFRNSCLQTILGSHLQPLQIWFMGANGVV